MFVLVHDDPARAEVRDADNLTALQVTVRSDPAPAPAAVAHALEPFGRLDGDHAWLSVEALRAAGPDDDGWRQRFDAMIAYADSKGWTDGRGAVRAHLEHEAGPAD